MGTLRITMHDDPVILYAVHADERRVGEVRSHGSHACSLHLGETAWWLADDVEAGLHARGASLWRRIVTHLRTPRSYSLRDANDEHVLARAQRRWHASTREDGLACEVGGEALRVRSLGAWGGRFALEEEGGRALGELGLTGLGRSIQAVGLALPVAESVFLLYATHRVFGHDVRGHGSAE